MTSPQHPPQMAIPPSKETVEISIIDTTSYLTGFPAATFVQPIVGGFDTLNTGSYAFLIKHARSGNKHDTMLFDLGVRQDWENLPKTFVEEVKSNGCAITVDKDVATILKENHQDLNEVGAIIWSHWHFDHVGDPRTFPTTTDLIVGPGFKESLVPTKGQVLDSTLDERAWKGRELLEIDFSDEEGLRIGNFDAYDFYGDGSFYLLDSPGHAIGHISALARTTADPPTFILLGGDIAHHCGEFRPSQYAPLPDTIIPSPLDHKLGGCPGMLFQAIHAKNSRNEPFFDPVLEGGWHHLGQLAKDTIQNLIVADAYEYIFPVMAHDNSLVGIVDVYPKPANDWMAKGWKKQSYWGFLKDFTPEDEQDALHRFTEPPKPQMKPKERHDSAVSDPY